MSEFCQTCHTSAQWGQSYLSKNLTPCAKHDLSYCLTKYVWCPLYRNAHFDTGEWGVQSISGWEPHLRPHYQHVKFDHGVGRVQNNMRLPGWDPHLFPLSRNLHFENVGEDEAPSLGASSSFAHSPPHDRNVHVENVGEDEAPDPILFGPPLACVEICISIKRTWHILRQISD